MSEDTFDKDEKEMANLPEKEEHSDYKPVSTTDEAVKHQLSGMYQNWFLDYASYVILERAVPHINDGLKPVQRRILHSMKRLDDGRYNKVANIVGHTMQFHPHGDASIGDALVQLGQKDLLIDCQGNWGNILTGDSAAAPRYIEARLSKFALDVVFNTLLIFPTGTIRLGALSLPGAGLGTAGAALGTGLAELAVGLYLLYFVLRRSPALRLEKGERLHLDRTQLRMVLRIAAPVASEKVILSTAQIVSTAIVAPLGTVAIAANSFAVTAESLCYMPAYGIQSAAAMLVGQSVGAGRRRMARRLGWVTVLLGIVVMVVTGGLLYAFAPQMMAILTPDSDIIALGTRVLRIEAFAEAMYGASIVAGGVFQGAGSTLVPTLFNLGTMWGIRLPLAWLAAPRWGLPGVWAAMCAELCVRGLLYLIRLGGKRWLPPEGPAGQV